MDRETKVKREREREMNKVFEEEEREGKVTHRKKRETEFYEI